MRSNLLYAHGRLTLDPVRESVERATSAMRAVVDADREKRKQEKDQNTKAHS